MGSDLHIFRSVDGNGNVHEVEMTPEQSAQLVVGSPLAYCPRDERVSIDAKGRVVYRESAVPEYRDAS